MGFHAGPCKPGFAAGRRHLLAMTDIERIDAPWQGTVLVCGKCSRKLAGGFGRKGRDKLKSVLRDALKAAGRRRELRVIEVPCLGLCPKRAVTVIGPYDTGHVLAIPAGTAADAVLDAFAGKPRSDVGGQDQHRHE